MYTKHDDPGHGWLEVDRAELHKLGIADKISGYSYQHEDKVFLEEDCDITLFLKAKESAGEPVDIETRHEDPTPIRNYASYAPAIEEAAEPQAKPAQVIALNNITRAVAVACSTDETRQVLQGVFITPARTVATNGRMLLMAKTQLQDAEELPPDIANCVAPLPEAVNLPADILNSAAKPKGKKSRIPCLRQAYLCNGSIVKSDLATTEQVAYKGIEGRYPNYEQVLPKDDPEAVVSLSFENMDKLVKAAKLAGATSITFGVRGKGDPISITMQGQDIAYEDPRTIEGVVMPMRIR